MPQRASNYDSSRYLRLSLTAAVALALAGPALAQEEQAQESTGGATSTLLEEVTVTARKREEAEQQVPLSISAFSGEQLEALKIRDLQDLSVNMPNVTLEDVATLRGVANFSIRGLGINSSIPSIDPTVGVFIDGVYQGQNGGVVLDMFDIASIEVLRGPQGTLFGRNVTGGAILINTKKPTDEFDMSFRAAVDGGGDGGLTTYAMGAVSGPMTDNVSGRLSLYWSDDDGYFKNAYDNSNHGKAKTVIFRPSVSWAASDDLSFTLRYEHLEVDGDGPTSQNHTNGLGIPPFWYKADRDSFDFSIDEPGYGNVDNDLLTLQMDWDVAFGNGTITNIFGWKNYYSRGLGDIDAQPVWLFHAPSWNKAEQYSNELRYSGNFGNAQVTTGVFWFTNEINYHERRELLGIATGGVRPALQQDGGGNYNVDSLAWFGEVDYALTDTWTLTLGARYTDEDKEADIASLVRNVNRPCNVVLGDPKYCPFDFTDEESWGAWSGKAGFTWAWSDAQRLYGTYSRSQRSGGYNLRNTAIDTVNLGPGPFDEEVVDNFELGFKSELSFGGRLNAAVFFMQIDDMQREVNLADPISGVVQVLKNTADAEIWGFEVDAMFALGDHTVVRGAVGYNNPEYTAIFFDLTGDGVIDGKDLALQPPRAPEWTYNVGLTHDIPFNSGGTLSLRADYAFIDDQFYTDNNLGYFQSRNNVTAGVDYYSADGHWVYSLYGRNLLDEVGHGGDTQLPTLLGPVPLGGTFSPLQKGRVYGVEVTWNY